MSQWTDRFEQNPIHQALRSLMDALDQADAIAQQLGEAVEPLHRLRSAAVLITNKLDATDPELVLQAPLDQLHSQVNSMASQVQSFASAKNVAYLNQANTQLDTALSYLPQLVTYTTKDEVEGLREAVTSLRRAVGQHLRYVESDVAPLRETVENLTQRTGELAKEIAHQRKDMTTVMTEFQSQFSAAQEKRLSDFAEAQRRQNDEFTTIKNDHAEKLSTALADFETETTNRVTDFDTWQTQVREEVRQSIKKLETTYATDAKNVVENIDGLREEAQKLVGIIGNVGVISGYQRAANEARRMSGIWQLVTLLAMGLLIWIAYDAFLPISGNDFSWAAFAGRVYVSLTVGALAAYAAYQGKQYHQVERRNRRLELELHSLPSYLAPLPLEKQHEVIMQVADRRFGRDEENTSEGRPPTTPMDLVTSPEARSLVRDIVKSSKS
jgi:ElaB/YqjD/DUF883 family membrane-anchored ribosome-binding protein